MTSLTKLYIDAGCFGLAIGVIIWCLIFAAFVVAGQ